MQWKAATARMPYPPNLLLSGSETKRLVALGLLKKLKSTPEKEIGSSRGHDQTQKANGLKREEG